MTRIVAPMLLMLTLGACHSARDADSLMAQARQYRARGETRSAIIELKNALQKAPDNANARLLLGEVYIEAGDAASADKELRKAKALGMAPAEVLPRLGKVMLMQGQFQKLLDDLQPDPAGPRQAALLVLRANAHLGLGDTEQARQQFDEVLAQEPDLADALLGQAKIAAISQHLDLAAERIERALAKHPDNIECLRFKGDLQRLQGKEAEALLTYKKILTLQPNNTQAHVDSANLLIQGKKLAEARAEIDAARKNAPGSLQVFYTQALLDFQEAKYPAARDTLQQILRAMPDHMPSVLLMGSVQLAMGSYLEAELSFRKFLDTTPHQVYASKRLAGLLLRSGKTDDALSVLEPLLEANRKDVELLALAGQAQMQARHFAKAAEYFQAASDLAPQTASLHTSLGLSRLGAGESARAVAELEQATTLDDKSGRAGILLAMTYLRNQEYDKALSAITAMERHDGKNPLVQNMKGGILLSKHDLAGARAGFEQALALDPSYLPALENLAQMDLAEKKPEQARQRYEAALAKDKRNVGLMTALARLALRRNNAPEAMRWLERATAEHPDALTPALLLANLYQGAGARDKALKLAQSLLTSHPADPDALALLAQIQVANGNYEAGLENYGKLAGLQPASAAVQLRRAYAQAALKDKAGALDSAKKALRLKPDWFEAQVLAATLLVENKDYTEALALAQTVQRQRPDLPAGLTLEGDIWMERQKPQEALRAYEQAFKMSKLPPLAIKLHQALLKAGKSKEANQHAAQWLQQHPAELSVRLYLASAELSAGRYPAAIGLFESIVRLDPKNAVALNNLAWAYQQEKDERALATAEQAYRLAGTSPAVLDTLGWILSEQGDTGRALPLLRKANTLAPDTPDISYHLGLTLLKAGNIIAARRQLEQLLASGKDFPKRAEVKAKLDTM
ncbi:XrtA/PEP-CTERM system TPR-repeat protein PrsT [Duganella vulcania]|uniref:PEP-CTERM system TPR-repeat protein PrsT n=1 Tax=Duganella vulcania TaxID=2692166 RepID=A0A845GJU2_9BURK|nr:XrtA/PEP-CTERM system TPR-repeat protein PrsT [Duganella vulcania]MYM93606.1 PEP-CTERM system TPR-repeat protein PrsT [Duganella vulcania]